jgi:A/G-specific adenine glycosylase
VGTTPFARRIINWQIRHGRHDLPWQGGDAYRVWLSEIMLQQTQVATVIPYYLRFIEAFPEVSALAAASEDEVLAHWSGLGYYARGRNLHRAARHIMGNHGGEFPRSFDDIMQLPGIGRSTAAAICALAWHEPRAILDGNVKRVLARWCDIEGWAGEKQVEVRLWQQSEALLPQHDIAVYTQGLMDLGASVCSRSKPKCAACPLQSDCSALQTGKVNTLPTPRPRKTIPQKRACLLMLTQGNEILLEKRPPAGIWGGLWCSPQFDDEDAALDWCARNNIPIAQKALLPEFSHTFTHFKLQIAPLRIELSNKPSQAAMEQHMAWMDVDGARHSAIPSPLRGLLEAISCK